MSKSEFKVRKVPSQVRAKATVEAIFEAALQVLERTESPDTPVHEIAERAGVSVGSLYQYFPTKASLVNALLSSHLKSRTEILVGELAKVAGLPAKDAARHLVTDFVNSMRPRLRVERALIRAFVRVGSLDSLTEYDEVMLHAVEQFLKSIDKDIRPVDVELAAFLIANTLRSAALLSVVQKPERLDDPQFTEELVHLVVSYLSPVK